MSASTTAKRMTLEQQRAADAWRRATGCSEAYVKLAKGVPALIMNSGLLQVLAFLHDKKGEEHKALCEHLREWLHRRFPELPNKNFSEFMNALMRAKPRDFQMITIEAFAWLRWMRQIGAAARMEGA